MSPFSHMDEQGRARMVDVSEKPVSAREAVAQGVVTMERETFELIRDRKVKKGNVLEVARTAGVMAAKKAADLIPMCHPLSITHVAVDFFPDPHSHSIRIESAVRVKGQTGAEMEALTAVSVAALTIYDMCKSNDRAMAITDIFLLRKSGGQSGAFVRESL